MEEKEEIIRALKNRIEGLKKEKEKANIEIYFEGKIEALEYAIDIIEIWTKKY